MQELARKKATVLMILSTPLARRKGELLEAVLRRLHLFFLLVLALLNKLIAPIVPPIKLLILSLAPGFDPKKLRKQEDRPRPRQ